MSYTLDVYRGTVQAQKNPLDIGLYVSFFPQLVAGPIVRYSTIAHQIHNRAESWEDFCLGVKRFILGFSKKILLSNNMALVADAVFADPERSIACAWLGAIAYTLQIFFDFSGYSDMAIGLGRMFGFHFLENFDYPYISASVSEFWRRWHMSLGQWFRDYVYFPLGGSRVKTKGRLVGNLFVVWLLTGIWHGASWNFIFWGLMYFVLLVFEKLTGIPNRLTGSWQKLAYRLFTLLMVMVGWIFFRAEDLPSAVEFCAGLTGLAGNALWSDSVIYFLRQYGFYFSVSVLASTPLLRTLRQRVAGHKALDVLCDSLSVPVYLLLLIWSVSYILMGSHNPFIYFNF